MTSSFIKTVDVHSCDSVNEFMMYVCRCTIYEIDERYPLDATIYDVQMTLSYYLLYIMD